MAEHKVGNTVVLVGTIVEIHGDIALVQVDNSFPAGTGTIADRAFPAGTGTIAVRLGKLPAAPYDEIHGDEDRIRDAMTEAHNHPGRTITR